MQDREAVLPTKITAGSHPPAALPVHWTLQDVSVYSVPPKYAVSSCNLVQFCVRWQIVQPECNCKNAFFFLFFVTSCERNPLNRERTEERRWLKYNDWHPSCFFLCWNQHAFINSGTRSLWSSLREGLLIWTETSPGVTLAHTDWITDLCSCKAASSPAGCMTSLFPCVPAEKVDKCPFHGLTYSPVIVLSCKPGHLRPFRLRR